MSDLTSEGKIVIFKALAISKVVHLALINTVSIFTVKQLNIIRNNFIWQGKKIHSTLSNNCKNGDPPVLLDKKIIWR